MLSVACWAFFMDSMGSKHRALWAVAAPTAIIVATLASWWPTMATQPINSARFALGNLSFADAYRSQGGLEPSALAIFEKVPRGSRIWSTSTGEHCMAPDCVIESVVSFKLSDRLNDVLNGSPETAQSVLRSEGLNYFIYSSSRGILDVLPYSRLFAPWTIGRYLGIKWTDGTEYLLTWRGPGIQPLGARFMDSYVTQYYGDENLMFKFRELPPYMNSTLATLLARRHPWHNIDFTWRRLR
jgi:hypothetical protein